MEILIQHEENRMKMLPFAIALLTTFSLNAAQATSPVQAPIAPEATEEKASKDAAKVVLGKASTKEAPELASKVENKPELLDSQNKASATDLEQDNLKKDAGKKLPEVASKESDKVAPQIKPNLAKQNIEPAVEKMEKAVDAKKSPASQEIIDSKKSEDHVK